MATRRWKGKAKDVPQVDSLTIGGTWAQNDVVKLTIDGIDVNITIGTLVTTAQVATTVKEAFNGTALTDTSASCSPTIAQGGAQAIGQFAEYAATINAAATSVVVFTARVAGNPITMTADKTSTSGTVSLGATTAATGSNWFSNADNWTGDTVPVDNDTIIFDSGAVDCCYGLSPAIQPAAVIITKGYTGNIGLLEINSDNASKPYNEYRTKYLTFDDNSVTCTYSIEQGDGAGSSLIRIDAGAGQSIFNVYGAGTRAVTGQPTTLLLGTHASNVLNVQQGDVGVAWFDGESSTLVTIRCGNGTTSGAVIALGDGVTLTSSTIDVVGGTLVIDSATASGDIDISSGGTVTIESGAQNNIDIQNGRCIYKSTGTLTTLAVRSSGTFDKSQDQRAVTITNAVQMYKGATFKDPNKSVTASAGYTLNGCTPADVTWNVGTDRTYAVT